MKKDPIPPHIKKLRLQESIDRLDKMVRMDAPAPILKFGTMCITDRIYGGELQTAKYHFWYWLSMKVWHGPKVDWIRSTWWCFWNGKSHDAWVDHVTGEEEGTTAIEKKEFAEILRGKEPSDKVN